MIDPIITYIAQWAVLGAIFMIVLPKFKWKNQITRRLFIFAMGPFVWVCWGMLLIGVKFGLPLDYWKRQ